MSASSLLWVLLFVSIFVGFALEMLWGAFQTLQIVLAMTLLAIKMPANVIVVFRGFSDVINLDVVDKQTLYDFTFGRFVPPEVLESDHTNFRVLTASSSSSSTVETLGYAQSNVTRDILLAVLAVISLLVLTALVLIVKKYWYNKLHPSLKRLFDSVKAFLMWDKILTWTTETYQSMAIGSLHAVKKLTASSFLALKIIVPIEIVYLIVWPALIFSILYRNRSNLTHHRIRESIGSLYMQLNTEKQSCLHFTMFNLYRRLIFALIINFNNFYTFLQLATFTFNGLVLITYIYNWWPMESTLFNVLAVFNESMLVVMGYQMYLFTDFVPDPETRFLFGKTLLWLVYFDIGANLVCLGLVIRERSTRWLKKQFLLLKHKIAMDHIKALRVQQLKDKEIEASILPVM